MKYIVTRTSCGNEETQPCPGAELTKLTIYRDVRFWKTLEEFKKNCPSLFKDNPETGYTEKGQPFVILKRENLVWTIEIEDLTAFVKKLGFSVILFPPKEEYPELPGICVIEIYDERRE